MSITCIDDKEVKNREKKIEKITLQRLNGQ